MRRLSILADLRHAKADGVPRTMSGPGHRKQPGIAGPPSTAIAMRESGRR